MRLPQIHATTVLHPNNKNLSWQFLVVPAHSDSGPELSIDLSLINQLQLSKIRDIEPSLMPFLVATMLEHESSAQILQRAQSYAQAWPWEREKLPNGVVEALEFAEQVVFRELVPFERSLLAQESLASITSSVSDAQENMGAALVEFEEEPFVIVAHRDGLVIGVARPRVLNSIWEKIISWILLGG